MKSLIAILVFVSSTYAFADSSDSKAEAIRLANVIVDNPKVVAELKKETVNIVDYSVVEDGKGVNTFTFKIGRTCYCMPKPGTLTIVQDLRPSFADGAIEYRYELKWEK